MNTPEKNRVMLIEGPSVTDGGENNFQHEGKIDSGRISLSGGEGVG